VNAFGIYDTPEDWCRSVVSAVQVHPDCVIDLGAGAGGLLSAAAKRWTRASLVAAEQDQQRLHRLQQAIPRAEVLRADLLAQRWPSRLRELIGQVDVAVCNPPFQRIVNGDPLLRWLERAGLSRETWPRAIHSELIFLAQNLAMLRPGGELAIILPDGIISGMQYRATRAALLAQHEVRKIVALPNCFRGTEARTHLMLIVKGAGPSERVELSCPALGTDLLLPGQALIERADPEFHLRHARERGRRKALITLGDIGTSLVRGALSSKALHASGHSHFHTTSFAAAVHGVIDGIADPACHLGPVAASGDLLFARVGSRCLGRIARVRHGAAPISDCLFRLRVPAAWRDRVQARLQSASGQMWLMTRARGVCARYLTREDLLRFPLDGV
jgi:type I restriction enzyme M protein